MTPVEYIDLAWSAFDARRTWGSESAEYARALRELSIVRPERVPSRRKRSRVVEVAVEVER